MNELAHAACGLAARASADAANTDNVADDAIANDAEFFVEWTFCFFAEGTWYTRQVMI